MFNYGISSITSSLGENSLLNRELHQKYPDWDIEQIEAKTGVKARSVAAKNTTALDLSIKAINCLLEDTKLRPSEVGGVIVCTSMPDFVFPGNSSILHGEFDFDERCIAFDINLACSAYPYCLGTIKSFLLKEDTDNVILVNGDTYSKLIHPEDRSTRVLFGDGVAASLVTKTNPKLKILDAEYFSSGNNFRRFIVERGGARSAPASELDQKKFRENFIKMDGLGILSFFSTKIPQAIESILKKNNLKSSDIDLFIPHQASLLAINALAKQFGSLKDRFYIDFDKVGNLTSASLPVTIQSAMSKKLIKRGDKILLIGFGVGLSWSTMLIEATDEID